jgi:hypothetical protein
MAGLPSKSSREVIVAFDFFTVPTVTFQLLYCFFVIEHGRRRILHCNITYPAMATGCLTKRELNVVFGLHAPRLGWKNLLRLQPFTK